MPAPLPSSCHVLRGAPAWRFAKLVVGIAASLVACGGAPAPAPEAANAPVGSPSARPTSEVDRIALPACPIPRASLTPAVREQWERIELVLIMPAPVGSTNATDGRAWGASIGEWLRTRIETITSALELARPDATPWELPMLAAAAGHAFERTVAELHAVPLPPFLTGDPAARAAFDQTLESGLAPLLEQATTLYGLCASRFHEAGDPRFAAWERYCEARGAALPSALAVP